MSAVSTGDVIEKASYTHAAMIDQIVANPMVSQGDLARHFGFTQGWVSQILRSDALREMLSARRSEVTDPLVMQAVERRFEALANRSIDILMDQLDTKGSADVALKALDITARAMGYGVKQAGVQLTQNFVVAMPQKAVDGDSWVTAHSPRAIGLGKAQSLTIDTEIVV